MAVGERENVNDGAPDRELTWSGDEIRLREILCGKHFNYLVTAYFFSFPEVQHCP